MRQLFPAVQGTDPEDLMPSDDESQSICSTIESPRHDVVDDYLSNDSTSDHARVWDDEFSTDVSSTRKRRK